MKKILLSAVFASAILLTMPVGTFAATSTPKMAKKALGRAAIGNGQLTAKSGTTLTVSKDGKSYSVSTDGSTKLRRRFWGNATLGEMQVGDSLNVYGRWTDDAHTMVVASLIRDISIQKRNGVFFGAVQSISGDTIVIQTPARGTETITLSAKTKLTNRKGGSIAKSDIKVGDRIRVRGLWDSQAHTITEVTQLRDFNLPVK